MFKKIGTILLLVLLGSLLGSCTRPPTDNGTGIVTTTTTTTSNKAVDLAGTEDDDTPAAVSINGNLWDDMQDYLQLPDYSYRPEVQAQIGWFQSHQRYLNQIIRQAAPYLYYIFQQTRERHMPAELALIPIIESNYNPFRYSTVGADGLWQLMPGTASGRGIKIDWWYDGRRDIITSTKAALNYLAYLNDFFTNNWLKAIAAYDCGEGVVQKRERDNRHHERPTDFWALNLPKETQVYVPKLLALAAIIRDPERYGINLLPINDAPYLAQVDVGSQIDLSEAARLAGISLATMHQLNPGFRRWATDPSGPYTLLVPADKASGFIQRLGSLPESRRVTWQSHIVKRGDTLDALADHYKTKPSILKQVNHLSSNTIRPGHRLLIPVSFRGSLRSPIVKEHATIAEDNLPGPHKVTYVVRRGETLWTIADKYRVTPRQIRYWNNLPYRSTTLAPNEHLLIWAPTRPHYTFSHHYKYKVLEGDSLSVIASRFNSSPKAIARANRIRHNIIHAGQILTIPTKSYRITHTIRPGDNILTLAHRYHVTAQEIQRWNDLQDPTKIRPGHKLYIYPA